MYAISYYTYYTNIIFVGGQVDLVAYINPYLDQTDPVNGSSHQHLLGVFWAFVSVGRFLGVLDQRTIVSDESLIRHICYCSVIASIALLLTLTFPSHKILLYCSVSVYALLYGPVVGYCHDLNNRLTLPTEKSTSIVMLGINCGASFYPYLTSLLWSRHGEPSVLFAALVLSMALPLFAIGYTQAASYKPDVREFHLLRRDTLHDYHSIAEGHTSHLDPVLVALGLPVPSRSKPPSRPPSSRSRNASTTPLLTHNTPSYGSTLQ